VVQSLSVVVPRSVSHTASRHQVPIVWQSALGAWRERQVGWRSRRNTAGSSPLIKVQAASRISSRNGSGNVGQWMVLCVTPGLAFMGISGQAGAA
jgi:hypothetical protein